MKPPWRLKITEYNIDLIKSTLLTSLLCFRRAVNHGLKDAKPKAIPCRSSSKIPFLIYVLLGLFKWNKKKCPTDHNWIQTATLKNKKHDKGNGAYLFLSYYAL